MVATNLKMAAEAIRAMSETARESSPLTFEVSFDSAASRPALALVKTRPQIIIEIMLAI